MPKIASRRPKHAPNSTGGQYAGKEVPDIDTDTVGFVAVNTTSWDQLAVNVLGLRTVFTRNVETDSDGTEVVTIKSDCDDPSLLLLAKKGDVDYWSRQVWSADNTNRRIWAADICVSMLQEGLIDTAEQPTGMPSGVETAMIAASSQASHYSSTGSQPLTAAVAQIRGLRLLQSMAGDSPDWGTWLGGYYLPLAASDLLRERFHDVHVAYKSLPPPPWGPQPVSHATTSAGTELFVGEQGDLLWRALTETDLHELSPVKEVLSRRRWDLARSEMVTAAALYDNKAAQQLTTDLFAGVTVDKRETIRTATRDSFAEQLNPRTGDSRWTVTQQEQIRGFIETVDALTP